MLEQKYRLHKSTTCTTQVAIRYRYRKLHILFRKFQSTHNTYVRWHPVSIYIYISRAIYPLHLM